jgi:hypothetical protein
MFSWAANLATEAANTAFAAQAEPGSTMSALGSFDGSNVEGW